MEDHHLIVSNPPHDVTNLRSVAPYFDLTLAEIRMKTNYPVPEIWFAERDWRRLEPTTELLVEAGLNTVVLTGRELAAIPRQTPVESFSFADTGLIARWDESEVTVAYDAPVICVFCQPRKDAGELESAEGMRSTLSSRLSHGTATHSGRSSVAMLASRLAAPTGLTFLDIYSPHEGGLLRISVIQDVVDFSGLHKQLLRPQDNMMMFVAECEDRFTNAQFDRRLVGMRLRKSATVSGQTPPQFTGRRSGFSYATTALTQLLDSVSPDLKGVSQHEMSSRLAYLAKR